MTPSNGRSFLMLEYILVMVGGALGTGARFWVSGFVAERGGELFPLGTLVVNITGSFAVGFLAAFMDPEGSFLMSPRLRQFFMIGVCGGYTTRWRLVQSRPEYTAFICLLSCSRLAWTRSCSRNIAEIETTSYAPS
jgi:hypothetical protein